MEDRSNPTVGGVSLSRKLAIALAVLTICVETTSGQSSVRVLGAPNDKANSTSSRESVTNASLGAASDAASLASQRGIDNRRSAATVDGDAVSGDRPPASPPPIKFAGASRSPITPIEDDCPIVTPPSSLHSDDYRFATAMPNGTSQPTHQVLPETIVPRPITLVPSDRADRRDEQSASQRAAREVIAVAPTRIALQPSITPREPAGSLRRNDLGDLPSVLANPPLVASQPEIAHELPSTQHSHAGDAIVIDSNPCCENEVLLPYGCPYYPGQSGARSICGVDCGPYGAACCEGWDNARWIPWSLLGPGEYVGPPRPEHVPVYYLRVNDLLTLTYIVSRQKQAEHYQIGVGDRLRIESSFDETLERELLVQPDGEISLPLIGDVQAAGKTIKKLRDDLNRRFGRIERDPQITVTPLEVNAGLREILNAVTSQSRLSGQAIDLRVTPEGTIQAPGLGSVYVQGLAIEELRSELVARYAATFGPGLLVSPALSERATSYVFIGGEVVVPGRYTLEGPTTVMQAIALAGGWNNGGNTREIVVFRRDENWCLKATKIDVHRPLYGKDPCPVNDVWLRDNDLVIVPKSKILCAADVIELYFTRGVYAVFPITFVKDFSTGSTMTVPIP